MQEISVCVERSGGLHIETGWNRGPMPPDAERPDALVVEGVFRIPWPPGMTWWEAMIAWAKEHGVYDPEAA